MNILLVEDSVADQFLFNEYMRDTSFSMVEIVVVTRMSEAVDHLRKNEVDIVFLDLSLPDSFGIESITSLSSKYSSTALIVLTGLKNDEIALKALEHGAQDYLVKGDFDGQTLERSIKYSLERQKVILERQLSELAFQEGQELERARISREIHDGLGQMLVLTKMRVERLADASIENIEELLEVKDLLNAIILEARGISENIVPSVLNELGLVAAISHICDSIRQNSEVKIIENLTEIDRIESIATSASLFRITQEAMNNSLKYAEATELSVYLIQNESELNLRIADNGRGIPEDYVPGNGLNNIKDRVMILDGRFEIDSTENGTIININIPLRKNGRM